MITFDANITAMELHSGVLFVPGGEAWRWTDRIKREFKAFAHQKCPPNRSLAQFTRLQTGALNASIYGTLSTNNNDLIIIDVGASAPYAKYVHEGTAAQGRNYIYTREGYANRGVLSGYIKKRQFEFGKGETGLVMPLPPSRFHNNNLALRVHGQKANPFITDAYAATARIHSALPPKRFKRTLD